VLSAANRVFAAELCCLQRIRCSLLNLCCLQRIRCSLLNWCCLKRIRGLLTNSCYRQGIRGSLLNCVLRSESGVRCRILLCVAIQVFATEYIWSHGIRCSLLNLCCP
jgi:hypothetical protein